MGTSTQDVTPWLASDRCAEGINLIARNPINPTLAVLQHLLQGEHGDERHPVVGLLRLQPA